MNAQHPIPAGALDKHIAILGKTGSGKSNLAKTVAEDLLARDQRVCVIDPTGTWWGLRLQADGDAPSDFPIVIFGGQHADLPLGPAHGEAIARVVGTSPTSAIVDTRLMSVSDRTRFFTGFAETLIRENRGELTLIIDEAHVFMPQAGARSGGGAPAMLHAGNNLVSLGRGVGLRIILISQRPAKLHKDSLTQVETLVAMRLIAVQDRRAINDWIGEWADAREHKGLAASLPDLKTGEAWVWSPEIGHLERAQCPLASTYDSGHVRDQDRPDLVPLDVSQIAAELEAAGADVLADDPKRLRHRIAELERELRERPTAVDEAEIERRVAAAVETIHAVYERHVSTTGTTLLKISRDLRAVAGKLDGARGALVSEGPPPPPRPGDKRAPCAPLVADLGAQPKVTESPICHPKSPRSSPDLGARMALSGPQRRILDALAWLNSLGFGERASRLQVAFLAEYKPGGGAFNNTLGSLRSAGLIQYPSSGEVALTGEGHRLVRAPDAPLTSKALQQAVKERLTGPQRRVLEPLIDRYPLDMGCDELAQEAGYEAKGGAFNNTRGSLRSLGLIDYPAPGRVAALDVLFVEGSE